MSRLPRFAACLAVLASGAAAAQGYPQSWGLRWGVGGMAGADVFSDWQGVVPPGTTNAVTAAGGLGVYGRLGFQWGNHLGTEAELSGAYAISAYSARLALLVDWNVTDRFGFALGPCLGQIGPGNLPLAGALFALMGRVDFNFLVQRTRWGRRNAMTLSLALDVGDANIGILNTPSLGGYVMLGYSHY